MNDFIIKPKVKLIGKSIINIEGLIAFLEDSNMYWPEFQRKLDSNIDLGDDDGNWLIEFGGRNCYQSWPKKGEELKGRTHDEHLKHLIDVGHESCLEHATFNFQIWNVSRSLTHELVRTRIGVAYCLSGDTIINGGIKSNGKWSNRGEKRTIKQIYEWTLNGLKRGNVKKIKVRCFDGEQFVQANIKSVQKSGIKNTYTMILENGKQICCSKDHKFLVKTKFANVWKSLQNIKKNDLIATNGIVSHKSKEWLYEQYYIKNLLPKEIANICRVSRQTIMNWIKYFNIQKSIRPPITELTRKKLSDRKSKNNSPAWKGNLAGIEAGRARARRWYKSRPCEKCRSINNIVRHHIDRNTLNNDINNIIFLCSSCHRKLHNDEDGHPNCLTIKWTKVIDIKYCCKQMTYDLEIDHPAHNFVANGFVTHNSQLSQRYVDSSNVSFIIPGAICELGIKKPEILEKWKEFCLKSRNFYEELTIELSELYKNIENKTEKRKKARQAARSVLPGCTETKIMTTLNGRSVRYFMSLRGGEGVEPEIRSLSVEMFKIMQQEFPLIVYKMELFKLQDGSEGVRRILNE